MPENRPYLTVAIAAFNEEHRLPQALDRALAMLATWPQTFEVVVCDDGSTDRTAELVEDYAHRGVRLVRLRRNRGERGRSTGSDLGIARRVRAVLGRRLLYTHHRVVAGPAPTGSRRGRDHDWLSAPSRRDGHAGESAALPAGVRQALPCSGHALVAVRGIGDTQAGFKALRGDVAREVFARMKVESIVFDVELLHLAQRSGYRVREVPVRWTNAGGSRMRVTLPSRRAGPVGLAPHPLAAPRRAPDAGLRELTVPPLRGGAIGGPASLSVARKPAGTGVRHTPYPTIPFDSAPDHA